MISYVIKFLKKAKGKFAFTILAFFTISLVVPLSLSSIKTSEAIVKQDITKYGRGSYDLLIRSSKSISDVEKKEGIVEENYLSSGIGGISLEQYNKIKSIKGVEVAAPVATIGYFSSAHNSIDVSFPYDDSYHINASVYTEDGIKDYLLQSSDYYQINSNFKDDTEKNVPINVFPESVKGWSNARGKIEYPIMLPEIWDMLVAVDFDAENKLIGLSKQVTSGSYITNEKIEDENLGPGIKGRKIPILVDESAAAPIKIKIKYDKYNIDKNTGDKIMGSILGTDKITGNYLLDEALNEKLKDKLKKNTSIISSSKTTDLSSLLKPFKVTDNIYLKDDGQSIIKTDSGAGFNQAQGSLYYKASPINYENNDNNIIAKAVDEKNGMLLFRNLSKVGGTIEEVVKDSNSASSVINDFNIIGYVRTPKQGTAKLTGAPLGMYGDNYVTAEGKQIHATTEPGSFVPSAPRAYTTLEALKYLKKENPIDAVRVRVAGIKNYDGDAKVKIQQVAKAISLETGLHVDVVAGSSNKQILVSVEGNNAAINKVNERWTTLGTALAIASTWNYVSIVLIILFIICGILFIINRSNSMVTMRRGEIAILKSIGWESKYVNRCMYIENILAAIVGLLLASAAIFFINRAYFLENIAFIFLLYGGIFLIAAPFLAYLFSKSTEAKVSMAAVKGNDVSMLGSLFKNDSIIKMAMNNVIAYVKNSLLIISQIGLASGVSVYTWLSLNAAKKSISATALGGKVNSSNAPITAVLIFGAMLLIVFTVLDRFSTIVMERKNYIGTLRAVGWKNSHVIKLILGEVLILGVVGTAVGAIISLTAFKLMYDSLPVRSIYILLAFLTIIFISLLSAIYPLYSALRISPLDAILDRDNG